MSWNFVRMLIIIISRSSLRLGHVGSKTRSLGQQATQVSDLGPLWSSCFTSDEYDLYFFTAANRGYFDNSGLNFFSKRSWMHCSCLTLCYGCTHIKQSNWRHTLTSLLSSRNTNFACDVSLQQISSGFLKPQISSYPFSKMTLKTVF